jgi:DNA-binding MarR family transcriptional regulator/GNAT superfamily N-acetyltransferase
MQMAKSHVPDSTIEAVRQFNRFYTKRIGVLHEGLLQSPFSLTEVRVLYELAHRHRLTASDIVGDLDLDQGYVSRILSSFEKRGLIQRLPSPADGRQYRLKLTRRGRIAFAPLDGRARSEVSALLADLPAAGQRQLIEAMGTVQKLLGDPAAPVGPYVLRMHQPGDMGWIVHRHGVLYAHEYGWNEEFEALVADIVAKFIHSFDSRRERCWIAERAGSFLGCVFLVKQSARVAKLRLLLVEPAARGQGVGGRLVEECVRFARRAGYGKITLWTNSVLTAARRLYERAGFRMVHEEPHQSFGHDLVAQTWELQLAD